MDAKNMSWLGRLSLRRIALLGVVIGLQIAIYTEATVAMLGFLSGTGPAVALPAHSWPCRTPAPMRQCDNPFCAATTHIAQELRIGTNQ
jgi:hypothetical protein